MRILGLALVATAVCACADDAPRYKDPWAARSLAPYENPFGPDHPLWAPLPHRARPRAAALSADGRTLYVTLQGREDAPNEAVAVVDLARRRVSRRIQVGRAPFGLALHPGGRFLVVTNLYSNYASVIDTETHEVVRSVPIPYYTTAVRFAPNGRRAYLTNRWKDSLLVWELEVSEDSFVVVGDNYRDVPLDLPMGTPVGTNPDFLIVRPSDGRVFVSTIAGGTIDAIDAGGAAAGRRRLATPIGGMALAGDYLVVTHIGHGTGHAPREGVDGDEDGAPGDGTGNVMFQDLQNELEVFDANTLSAVARATSDTTCCFDYRDVDPDNTVRGLLIPEPETWPPARAADLAPKSEWLVAGALPSRLVPIAGATDGRTRLLALMSASNEAQRIDVDGATGALTAVDVRDALFATGHFPIDVVAAPDGRTAYVVNHLGDSVSVLDLTAGPSAAPDTIALGAPDDAPFPASDVELGELFNAETARLTVDGDQSCVHCHRDGGNLDRVVAMPLQTNRIWGSRQVQAYRGAFDTRPWFIEAAMDENNFFPVLNEFNRKENFCCEGIDPLVWSRYPSATECLEDGSLEGCRHVLDCATDPPPECTARAYGSPWLTRDAFFLDAAYALTQRREAFGDSLRLEGTDRPQPLNFAGITRALGLFLLAQPRLLPNPNQALDLAAAARGRALYETAEVGCASCHPLPLTTLASEPHFSPARLPVRLPPVITPTLDPLGAYADLVTQGFRDTFSVAGIGATEQGPEGMHIGVPQLRGLWDRASRFYHDGRARSLRECLLTPGHPALLSGETGFNERAGVLDTHGGTSHLTPDRLDDLTAFLLSL